MAKVKVVSTKKLIRSGERYLKLKLSVWLLLSVGLFAWFYANTKAKDAIEALSLKLAFSVRSQLGYDVSLDPRLKIFGFDDKTASLVKMSELGFEGWAYVLKALAQSRPKAIVIDKVFSINRAFGNSEKFQKVLGELGVPVYVGAFFSEAELEGRDRLSQREAVYPYASLAKKMPYAYGPSFDLYSSFAGVGHLSLDENAKVFPLISTDELTLSHLGLLGVKPELKSARELLLGSKTVTLDEAGRMPVNLLSADKARGHSYSLTLLLKDDERRAELLKGIGQEDVVLVIPQLFTGNTDWKDTPRGKMEGGFILASLLNSQIKGEYLSSHHIPSAIGFFLIVLLGALAIVFRPLFAWFVLASFLLGSALLFFVSFLGFGAYWDLGYWVLVSLIVVVPIIVFHAKYRERRAQSLIQSLGSSMGSNNLQKILDQPEVVLQKPVEKEMTLLFLDIVGFSLVSDKATPDDLFKTLKSLIQDVEEIVYEHGGVVDKVLGDGLLCAFGSMSGGSLEARKKDVRNAINCALEIQRFGAKNCLNAEAAEGLVFPFRIGINTDKVHFGDIGGDDRIEFTCIGAGVNFAARLEAACEPFKVLIGENCYELLKEENLKFLRKRIQIKHYTDFFSAYEIDPFRENPEVLKSATLSYRKYHGLDKLEPRYPLSQGAKLKLKLNGDLAKLLDFSDQGFACQYHDLLSRSVLMDVSLESDEMNLSEYIERRIFVVEVRHSSEWNGGARLELEYKNLSGADRERMMGLFRSLG